MVELVNVPDRLLCLSQVDAVVKQSKAIEDAWALMGRLFWRLRPRLVRVAGEFGLTPPQLFALKTLDPDNPVPMSALATALQCDNSNVTGIVDRLEKRGLVKRRPAQHDRRVKLLVLTEEGQRLRELFVGRMYELPPAITCLSRADQRALRDILRRAVKQG